jgi:hypothetical protein
LVLSIVAVAILAKSTVWKPETTEGTAAVSGNAVLNGESIISVISVIMGAVIFRRNENRMHNIKEPMEDRYYEE